MLSETLATGLEQYKIGPKIRALRQKKDLGLVQLGEHTGLSPAMLSKIERGQLFPTLPTLLRIALVFGVGLEHFFVESAGRRPLAVVRKKDRLRLPDQPGEERPSYLFESLDFPVTDRKMEAFYAEFPMPSKSIEASSPSGRRAGLRDQGTSCRQCRWRRGDARRGRCDLLQFDSAAQLSPGGALRMHGDRGDGAAMRRAMSQLQSSGIGRG